MSEFVKTTAFTLAVYSNKNSSLFEQASENVVSKYEGRKDTVGIIYDDFNANMDIVKSFKKKYKNIKTYHVAPRRTTLQMDDKKFMAKRMNGSNYVPKHYEKNNIDRILLVILSRYKDIQTTCKRWKFFQT